jgi:hypothetical protein
MHNQSLITLKQQLLEACQQAQAKRVEYARNAMEDAQQAANQEEKSTAGDKYDTSRAMSQNVRDMNAKQLQEALKEIALLQHIKPEILVTQARLGSVVKTSIGNYFIAISGGPYVLGKEKYFSISPASPIGELLMNKQKGESFMFRDKTIMITDVF